MPAGLRNRAGNPFRGAAALVLGPPPDEDTRDRLAHRFATRVLAGIFCAVVCMMLTDRTLAHRAELKGAVHVLTPVLVTCG